MVERKKIRDRKEYLKRWNKKHSKEYRQRPEVKIRKKQYLKKYRKENKSKLSEQGKKYYKKNKIKRREYHKKWCQKNKEYCRKYYSRPEVKKRQRGYWKKYIKTEKGKKALIKAVGKYFKRRRKIDKNFAIRCRLRVEFYLAIKKYTTKGKIYSSSKYGIKYKAIIEHLKPFPKDLSKYHIDHIKPLCSFNLEDPEQIKQAFAPENHQWLLAKDNLRKGNKF